MVRIGDEEWLRGGGNAPTQYQADVDGDEAGGLGATATSAIDVFDAVA